MKRSLDQNAIFHCFCQEISDHIQGAGIASSPLMVKELTKNLLGNTTEFMSTKIAMPTSSYVRSDEDLSQEQLDEGVLSMESFITKVVVWASTDLCLELKSTNEEEA